MQLKVYMKNMEKQSGGLIVLKKFLKHMVKEIIHIGNMMKYDDISAFSASSAYFFILSFIPLTMLLMSLLHYTNLSREQLLELTSGFIPAEMSGIFSDIVDEVYGKTAAAVSLSAVITLWTSGKGFMALKTGMQAAVHVDRKKSYISLRIVGAVDAVVFLAIIIMALALGVCGQMLENMIEKRIDVPTTFWDIVVSFRKVIMLAVFIAIFSLSYRFIPEWKESTKFGNMKIKFIDMLPGAAVSAVGWHLYSALFSLYLNLFADLEKMYGSLSVLIGVMLWFYGCMYLVLAGLEINVYFIEIKEKLSVRKKKK